jgi:hypothetical protein
MKFLVLLAVVAIAVAPLAVRSSDEPALSVSPVPARPAPSLVLTAQGAQRHVAAATRDQGPLKPDAGPVNWSSARSTLLELASSIACTSMFAARPESRGTDPAASAGR